jgi:hypothetical protein
MGTVVTLLHTAAQVAIPLSETVTANRPRPALP